MPREPLSNIGFVCEKHAADDRKSNSAKSPKSFVGKHVKLGFPTGLTGPREPRVERMWVKTLRESEGKLIGVVDNDPITPNVAREYPSGTEIEFETNEILEVLS